MGISSNDIIALTNRRHNDATFAGKRVRIKFEDKYLVLDGEGGGAVFISNKPESSTFDYDGDKVGEQLETVQLRHARTWEAEDVE